MSPKSYRRILAGRIFASHSESLPATANLCQPQLEEEEEEEEEETTVSPIKHKLW